VYNLLDPSAFKISAFPRPALPIIGPVVLDVSTYYQRVSEFFNTPVRIHLNSCLTRRNNGGAPRAPLRLVRCHSQIKLSSFRGLTIVVTGVGSYGDLEAIEEALRGRFVSLGLLTTSILK
jgi:hypothetical protein